MLSVICFLCELNRSTMKTNRILIFLLLIIFGSLTVEGYSKSKKGSKVRLIARPLPDSIVLRWAPSKARLWDDANKIGYTLERYTILRDKKLLKKPEKVILGSKIKPRELADWEKYADDEYVSVAAHLIYNSSYKDIKAGNNIYIAIKKSEELDHRFGFSLFAADRSAKAADLSGLRYSDKSVKENEKYLYRVYLSGNPGYVADTGFVFTGVSEYQPLPRPIDFKAKWSDQSVTLSWNNDMLKQFYNGYYIERSLDGKKFEKITDSPIVDVKSKKLRRRSTSYHTDSLPDNSNNVSYRIYGLTSFAENGPFSDTISGKGVKKLVTAPFIVDKKVINNTKVELIWEFPDDMNGFIRGFKIYRSDLLELGYDVIADIKNSSQRKYVDESPNYSNYYKISAYVDEFEEKSSFTKTYVSILDTVPPVKPSGLEYIVDSTGNVLLTWRNNSDNDLYGYRVYRSNAKHNEMSQLTVRPVKDTIYRDRINLNTLTSKVYFRVKAVDKRQNLSEFSDFLEVKRPDKIAPVSPVITSVRPTNGGVVIKWVNSSSSDVNRHVIYRALKNSSDYTNIHLSMNNDSITQTFTDRRVKSGKIYSYYVVAYDEFNNVSERSNIVHGKSRVSSLPKGIDKLDYSIDRENSIITLNWNTPQSEPKRYLIYRKKGDGVLTLYKGLKPDELMFKEKITVGEYYEYRIKVIFKDGEESVFSDKVVVDEY